MQRPRPVQHSRRTGLVIATGALVLGLSGTAPADEGDFHLTVRSATFVNDATVPLSMVDSFVPAGSTVSRCTVSAVPGGKQSPQLSWSGAPRNTRTFVVVADDETAAFTHWGIYNISDSARGLPANAGVANSTFGDQVLNDFFSPGYQRPCPPMSLPPNVHHYRFAVYALASSLQLPGSPITAAAETLYTALLEAGQHGRILASASITGLYSDTPP